MNKQLAALAAALALAAPIAANADGLPSYAASAPTDQQIQGRVANFDGGFELQVNDANGYVDNVLLHQGTIINPRGLTLAPGMVVDITGFNSGTVFDANEIDTPYTFDAGVPTYAGQAWDSYGPSIALDFFFGSHDAAHGGGTDIARVNNVVPVENVREKVNNQTVHVGTAAPSRPVAPSRPSAPEIVQAAPVVHQAVEVHAPVEVRAPVEARAPAEDRASSSGTSRDRR